MLGIRELVTGHCGSGSLPFVAASHSAALRASNTGAWLQLAGGTDAFLIGSTA